MVIFALGVFAGVGIVVGWQQLPFGVLLLPALACALSARFPSARVLLGGLLAGAVAAG
jgi:hypothetical protein